MTFDLKPLPSDAPRTKLPRRLYRVHHADSATEYTSYFQAQADFFSNHICKESIGNHIQGYASGFQSPYISVYGSKDSAHHHISVLQASFPHIRDPILLAELNSTGVVPAWYLLPSSSTPSPRIPVWINGTYTPHPETTSSSRSSSLSDPSIKALYHNEVVPLPDSVPLSHFQSLNREAFVWINVDEVKSVFGLDISGLHRDEWLACGVIKERQIESVIEWNIRCGGQHERSIRGLLRENEELRVRIERLEGRQEGDKREVDERFKGLEKMLWTRGNGIGNTVPWWRKRSTSTRSSSIVE